MRKQYLYLFCAVFLSIGFLPSIGSAGSNTVVAQNESEESEEAGAEETFPPLIKVASTTSPQVF